MSNIVIVTGASGYIGGEIALKLKDAGHTVIGIDRRAQPKQLQDVFGQFIENDFVHDEAMAAIVKAQPRAIIHCAGTSLVGPSMSNPAEYYDNNVVKTIRLLDIVRRALPHTRVIFSSSASVYGTPIMNPCHEVDPKEPISPYGESKLIIEQVLESYRRAYNSDYVAFRYFNACSADSKGRHGQEPGATHIIARVLESMRDKKPFTLNGTDYSTEDGTCVRDYIHVEDIARAHIAALDTSIPAGVYNLGTANGTSNAEIIDIARTITGQPLDVEVGDRRLGDPDMLTAGADKFTKLCPDWKQFNLQDIITHAWAWYNR
jgi:UDP-glucose-4-epimerase GalE